MAHSIYITSAEGDTGKSTVALGVLDTLTRRVARVGVFRPIARSTDGARLRPRAAARARRRRPRLRREHRRHLRRRARRSGCRARRDRRAVQGGRGRSATPSSSSAPTTPTSAAPTELALNARIAANLGAPVLLVSRRSAGSGERSARDRAPPPRSARSPSSRSPSSRTSTRSAARASSPTAPIPSAPRRDRRAPRSPDRASRRAACRSGRSPRTRSSSRPLSRDSCDAVDGELLAGDATLLDPRGARRRRRRDVDRERAAAPASRAPSSSCRATAPTCCSRRSLAHAVRTFPSLAGIVLNGGFELARPIERLIDGLGRALPIIAHRARHLRHGRAHQPAPAAGSPPTRSARYDTALALFETHVDADALLRACSSVARPTVVTPLMFEYDADRAGARRRASTSCCPRATTTASCSAAGTLLAARHRRPHDPRRRGRGARPRGRARRRHLGAPTVVSTVRPRAASSGSPQEYARLRAHKGMTLEQAARHRHRRLVLRHDDGAPRPRRRHGVGRRPHDGAHHHARRSRSSRPARASSVVSSVFLMALADRVLVYGDCAVIPDPTAEQLADIAISSAATAAQFGIEPRVAMLSYSTGESGSGAEVDKVRAATALVRERAPELPVEGPIQYDAAADAAVARSEDARVRRSPAARRCSSSPTSTRATTPTRPCSAAPARSRSARCCRASTSRSTTSRAARSCATSSTPSRSPRSRRAERPPMSDTSSSSTRARRRSSTSSSTSTTERALATGLVERIGEPRSSGAHGAGEPLDDRSDALDAPSSSSDPRPRRRLRGDARHVRRARPSLDERRRSPSGTASCTAAARFSSRRSSTTRSRRHRRARRARAAAQPGEPAGIRAAHAALPDVPHVAVFDTAFHQTLPPAAYTYAIDAELAEQHGVRRYGFHGTSHQYVSSEAARVARPAARRPAPDRAAPRQRRVGRAVAAGASVDTSMGMTPLEGLVMGTRSGDIDPAVLVPPAPRRRAVDSTSSTTCSTGAAGCSGSPARDDMRDVLVPAHERATTRRRSRSTCTCTASARTSARTRRSSAGVDVLSFTAGVGENAPIVRARALAGLECLGIEIDPERNTRALARGAA